MPELTLPTDETVLDAFEPEWRDQGYKLIRSPSREELPDFISNANGDLQPDAIAIGRLPGLVIEVLRSGDVSGASKVRRLRRLLGDRDDWRLSVLYAPPPATDIERSDATQIRKALEGAAALKQAQPMAALLLAWSALEASVRARAPQTATGILPFESLTHLLVSEGRVTQDEGKALRRIGTMRNRVAHGQFDAAIDTADLDLLITICERIAS